MNIIKKLITRCFHYKLSELDKLYQKHAGEECYIFGDGISLKWMDLDQFKDRTAIIGNMMIYHKQVKDLNAPYCTITEPNWFWPIFPYGGLKKLKFLRHSLHKEYCKSINQNSKTSFFINLSNLPFTNFSNVIYVTRSYVPGVEQRNPFRERKDAHNGTLFFQISLAIFLGFKKAYLVGHDYTHQPSRSLHFYEKGSGIIGEHKDFARNFIEYAKKYIELTTITLDGKSETMDSVTYQDLTGTQTSFRENTEIVEKIKLDSLAAWPGYTIF